MAQMSDMAGAAPVGAWAPLRHRAFLWIWTATVLSNTGTWMNDVGAAWLMTELAPTPIMVALIQSATTLPVLCFALLAGVLTDRLDHKRMMLVINGAMAAVAGLMAVVVWQGAMSAGLLLLLTFLLNTGAAFLAPLWLATVPSLVDRPALPAALALNSMGINISRAIGPSLAGLVIVAAGLWAPFALNALSFVAILAAVALWRPEARGPKRRTCIRADLREIWDFLRATPAFRRVLLRAFGFFLSASAGWALLPVIARENVGAGSGGFGVMMGAIGLGAVLAALVLPRLRRALSAGALVSLGTGVVALCLSGLAMVGGLIPSLGLCLLFGMAWIAVLSSFHIATQIVLPGDLRGRGVAVFLMVFFGTMALFAFFWGALATWTTPPLALGAAAASAALALVSLRRVPLPG